MFTGLVEASGQLARRERRGVDVTLTLRAPPALVAELTLGESVAVDGACLTVTRFGGEHFSVDASAETLSRTTLGDRREGDSVHLERALRLADRLGGHIVAGHVDDVGVVRERRQIGDALFLAFAAPPAIVELCVDKGSITIDGVSLTINGVAADGFDVCLIPHTLAQTHLDDLRVGDVVNLESDVIGKYVRRLLGPLLGRGAAAASVDEALLRKAGFLR